MSTLCINFSDLSKTFEEANKTSEKADQYSMKLQSDVTRKINGIRGGGSSRISSALTSVSKKSNLLTDKSENFRNLSNDIKEFGEEAKLCDKTVAEKIDNVTMKFAEKNGIKIGKFEKFLAGLAISKINSSSLGRWINKTYNEFKGHIETLKNTIRQSEKIGYLKDLVLSGLAITAAVVTLFAASGPLAMTAAAVLLGFAIMDFVANLFNTGIALNIDDPALAYKYGKTDTVADNLRNKGNNRIATLLDITKGVAGIVSFGSSIKGTIDNGKDWFSKFGEFKGQYKNGQLNLYEAMKETKNIINTDRLKDMEFSSNKTLKFSQKFFQKMENRYITKYFKDTHMSSLASAVKFDGKINDKVFVSGKLKKAIQAGAITNGIYKSYENGVGIYNGDIFKGKTLNNINKIIENYNLSMGNLFNFEIPEIKIPELIWSIYG